MMPDSQEIVLGDGQRASEVKPWAVLRAKLRQREWSNVLTALTRTDGKVHSPGGTAELLGFKPTTLISRIKKPGLKRTA